MDPTAKLGDSKNFKHQQLVESLGSSTAVVRFYFLHLPRAHDVARPVLSLRFFCLVRR